MLDFAEVTDLEAMVDIIQADLRAVIDIIRADLGALVDIGRTDAAVHLDVHQRERPAQPLHLGHHVGHELLSAEAGLDRHHQQHVRQLGVRHHHLHSGAGLQADTHLQPARKCIDVTRV